MHILGGFAGEFFKYQVSECVCVFVLAKVLSIYVEIGTTFKHLFSPSAMWILGIGLRSFDLSANALSS